MDIEDPYENRRPPQTQQPIGRRTDNLTNEMKLFNMAERRGQAMGQGQGSKVAQGNIRGRGIDSEKQPLHSRNVRPTQVD